MVLCQYHRLVHALKSQNTQQEKFSYTLLANAQLAEISVYINTVNSDWTLYIVFLYDVTDLC